VNRRAFIAGVGGAVAWPLVARAQQPSKPIIGILTSSSINANFWLPFSKGLKEHGFVEGQNVVFETVSAEGQYDRLPVLAAELVHRNVSVILTNGAVSVPLALKAATTTIPIVFMIGSDPVQWGLVASLNRPGGNITGFTIIDTALTAKRLELIRQVAPSATVIGLLQNPNNPNAERQIKELEELTRANDLKLQVAFVKTKEDLPTAFTELVHLSTNAVLIGSDALIGGLTDQIVALAARNGMPVIYPFPVTGGLMTYGISLTDMFHQAGGYTGRILKGDKPADLPVIQSTKINLVINLKTAKSLGLTIPLSVLARADEVIE
jgi:putative tryptophan/tyrosine transport system substrate-binding protein